MALVQLSESRLSNSPSPILGGGCAPGLCDQVLEKYQRCLLNSKYKPCFRVLGVGWGREGWAAGRGSVSVQAADLSFPRNALKQDKIIYTFDYLRNRLNKTYVAKTMEKREKPLFRSRQTIYSISGFPF